jgi:hypothetical protein
MDPEWGHMIIKLCPHPPFNAQIILNGHEYMARQAQRCRLAFTKEGNCFTEVTDATGLARIADTMRASSSVGRLVRVCERWIYSACLCFTLDLSEQEKSGFQYAYSVYQVEYSRNLLFTRGRTLDLVFQGIIDRTRAPLNIKTIKTIFGYKHRPFSHHGKKRLPRFEVAVERPVYDLTIFKVHFGKIPGCSAWRGCFFHRRWEVGDMAPSIESWDLPRGRTGCQSTSCKGSHGSVDRSLDQPTGVHCGGPYVQGKRNPRNFGDSVSFLAGFL